MSLKKYKVIYQPFLTSDLTAECELFAKDEDDAKTVFERIYSNFVFISAEVIG